MRVRGAWPLHLDRRVGWLLPILAVALVAGLAAWNWRSSDGEERSARGLRHAGERVASSHGRSLYVAPKPNGDVDWTVVALTAQTTGTLSSSPAGGIQTTVRWNGDVTWILGRVTLSDAAHVDVRIGGKGSRAKLQEYGIFFMAVDRAPGRDDVVVVQDAGGRVLARIAIL